MRGIARRPRGASLSLLVSLATAIAVSLLACSSQVDALLAKLPTAVAGLALTEVRVIDETYRSGHPIDDVLGALSRQRRDASAVFREASDAPAMVGALVVKDVSPADLVHAVKNNWQAAAVASSSETRIGDKAVTLLEIRPNHLMAFYESGGVVYIAGSDEWSILNSLVAALP